MTPLLLGVIAVLVAAVAGMGWHIHRLHLRRKRRGLVRDWPIRPVEIDEFDDVFSLGPFGPSSATEVAFIGRGHLKVVGGTDDYEAWILAVLAKRARRIFEFGTCTGKTAYLFARNAPDDAEVVTLTLGPDDVGSYVAGAEDAPDAEQGALRQSVFTEFLYSGTPAEAKITQLFGDSKAFDEAPYAGACDLIFVDGAHAYSYVRNDSEKALRMLKPGGIVVWHDYRGPRAGRGVWRYLNELSGRLPLVHIAGSSLVAYRSAPAGTSAAD